MSSWDTGYGDFEMKPDLETLRPGAVAAGHGDGDGRPAVGRRARRASPRRARSCAASWLAWPSAGSAPTPPPSSSSSSSAKPTSRPGSGASTTSSPPISTTSTTRCSGTARVEPLMRRIRNEMAGAGMTVENSKGECNLGQHEINFRYAEALRCADDHAIYKNGAKEIASQEECAITFMAKFNQREGNSCHIHCSLAERGRRQRLRRRPGPVRALRRRPDRLHARADAALRAARQLLQTLRPRLLRADRDRLGPGQPDLLAAGGGPRGGPAGREPAAGRRRQSLPGAERADRRRPARDRRGAAAGAGLRGRRVQIRQAPRSPQHLRRPGCVRRQRRWSAMPSGTRSWSTT